MSFVCWCRQLMWTLPALDIVCLLVYTLWVLGITKAPMSSVIRTRMHRSSEIPFCHTSRDLAQYLVVVSLLHITFLCRNFTGHFTVCFAPFMWRVESSLFCSWVDIRSCPDVFVFHHLSPSEYRNYVGLSQETAIGMAIRDNHSDSSDRMVVRNRLETDTTVYSLGTQTKAYRSICTVQFPSCSSSLQSSCHPRAYSLSSAIGNQTTSPSVLLLTRFFWQKQNEAKQRPNIGTWCGNKRR